MLSPERAAEGADDLFAFLAHVFRHHDGDGKTHAPAHQSNADARVAGGRLHDGHARPEFATADGLFEHKPRDTVFDAAAGVEVFRFRKDRGPGHLFQADNGRIADLIEDIVGIHAGLLLERKRRKCTA